MRTIVFDAFSNPGEEQIRQRLAPFLDIIMKKHKKTPLIFVQTIHRGNTNFNLEKGISKTKNKRPRKSLWQISCDQL